MEDLGGLAPLVQILDLPVPQLVDNVLDASDSGAPDGRAGYRSDQDLVLSASFSFSFS